MLAMSFTAAGEPLAAQERPVPHPGPQQVLLKVRACGVCRTDLHVVAGDLTNPRPNVIPGHEIVGEVAARGAGADRYSIGQRVGVPWLGSTCGRCAYCTSGRENLCDEARFTGYQLDGGYAEYTVADERYCFALPDAYDDATAAPLLCAGLIGYRSLRMAGDARRLGIYGFGAAAHIIAQVARHQGRDVFAFTRPGDTEGQRFARSLGATWAGDSTMPAPEPLDAAILFAPVGELVPLSLKSLRKGGVVVCAGIHMSDIPRFPYADLWGERCIRSVANLTRQDGEEFLALAPQVPVTVSLERFPLREANQALQRLRDGQLTGAAVLMVSQETPMNADTPADTKTSDSPTPATTDDDVRVVVFGKPGDPHLIGEILCDVLHESGTDAVIHAHFAPGVLPVPVAQEQAERIVRLIQGIGIQATSVPAQALPRFDEAVVVHHARCQPDGLQVVDYRGDVAETIPWKQIDLIAIGDVPLPAKSRITDSSRPLLASAPQPPSTAVDFSTATGPELWLIRRDPVAVYHIEHRAMNYEALGDRMSQSATANFRLFVEDLIAHAPDAWMTPSTRAYLDHAHTPQYEFRSSDELQRQATLTWVMEQTARASPA